MTHKPYIGFYFPLVAEYRRNRTKFEILRLGFKYKCGLLPTVCLVRVLLCLTLCNPMDYSPPGSPVHGISQARILDWVAISFCRGSSPPGSQTRVSCIGRQVLCRWATWEAQVQRHPKANGNGLANVEMSSMEKEAGKEQVNSLT